MYIYKIENCVADLCTYYVFFLFSSLSFTSYYIYTFNGQKEKFNGKLFFVFFGKTKGNVAANAFYFCSDFTQRNLIKNIKKAFFGYFLDSAVN